MHLRSSQASSRLNFQEIPHPLHYAEKDYIFLKNLLFWASWIQS